MKRILTGLLAIVMMLPTFFAGEAGAVTILPPEGEYPVDLPVKAADLFVPDFSENQTFTLNEQNKDVHLVALSGDGTASEIKAENGKLVIDRSTSAWDGFKMWINPVDESTDARNAAAIKDKVVAASFDVQRSSLNAGMEFRMVQSFTNGNELVGVGLQAGIDRITVRAQEQTGEATSQPWQDDAVDSVNGTVHFTIMFNPMENTGSAWATYDAGGVEKTVVLYSGAYTRETGAQLFGIYCYSEEGGAGRIEISNLEFWKAEPTDLDTVNYAINYLSSSLFPTGKITEAKELPSQCKGAEISYTANSDCVAIEDGRLIIKEIGVEGDIDASITVTAKAGDAELSSEIDFKVGVKEVSDDAAPQAPEADKCLFYEDFSDAELNGTINKAGTSMPEDNTLAVTDGALQYTRNTTSGFDGMQFNFPQSFTADGTVFEFKVSRPSENVETCIFPTWQQAPACNDGNRITWLQLRPDGTYTYRCAGTSGDYNADNPIRTGNPAGFEVKATHVFKYVHYFSKGTYDLYIDDILVIEDKPTYYAVKSVSTISVMMTTTQGTGVWSLDDIKVYPEKTAPQSPPAEQCLLYEDFSNPEALNGTINKAGSYILDENVLAVADGKLQYTRNTTSTYDGMQFNFPTAYTEDGTVLEFELTRPSVGVETCIFPTWTQDNTCRDGNRLTWLQMRPDGTYSYRCAGTSGDYNAGDPIKNGNPVGFEVKATHVFKYVHNFTAGTYDLFIDDIPVITDKPTYVEMPQLAALSVMMTTMQGTGTWSVDNIKVYKSNALQDKVNVAVPPEILTSDFSLTQTSWDNPVYWESSNEEAVVIDGYTARVMNVGVDTEVILTAYVLEDGIRYYKTFTVVVPAAPPLVTSDLFTIENGCVNGYVGLTVEQLIESVKADTGTEVKILAIDGATEANPADEAQKGMKMEVYTDGFRRAVYTLDIAHYKAADLNFVVNGYEGYERFTSGTVAAKINIVNYSSEEVAVSVVLAKYAESNDMLLDLAVSDVNVSKGSQEVSASLEIEEPAGTYLKALAWDGMNSLQPLAESAEMLAFDSHLLESVQLTYPGYYQKAITFSYDDLNITQDARLIEIFDDAGIKATFNLVTNKLDNKSESEKQQIIDMYEGHETANHSYNHLRYYLTEKDEEVINGTYDFVPYDSVVEDIQRGSDDIEKYTGEKPIGFVWPYRDPKYRDGYDPAVREDYDQIISYIKNMGVKYIRPIQTTGTFDLPSDWYDWRATCHHEELGTYLPEFLNLEPDGELKLMYVWGHSFEFDETYRPQDADRVRWSGIEEYARMIKERTDIWKATNAEIYYYVEALKLVDIDYSANTITNNSDMDVYAIINGIQMIIPQNSVFEIQ